MKTYSGMEAVVIAGIVLLIAIQFTPSMAQQAPAPASFCWERIKTCQTGAMSQAEFQKVCCPVISQIVSFEKPCFCSIKSVANTNEVNQLDMVLGICNVTGSVDGICTGISPSPFGTPSPTTPSPSTPSPGPNTSPSVTPSAPPPGPNVNPNGVPPATSPASNLSPSGTPPSQSLSPSGTPPVASTPGQAPSLAPVSPMMPPLGEVPSAPPTLVEPPLGSTETPTSLGPAPASIGTTDENPPQGAGNKITMAGSLSGVLILMAYLLI